MFKDSVDNIDFNGKISIMLTMKVLVMILMVELLVMMINAEMILVVPLMILRAVRSRVS